MEGQKMMTLGRALHACAWGAAGLGLAMMAACDGGAAWLMAEEGAPGPLPAVAKAAPAVRPAAVSAPGRARPTRLWWRVSTGALGGPA